MNPHRLPSLLAAALVLASPAAFALEGFSKLVSLPADVKVADAVTRSWDEAAVWTARGEEKRVGKVTTAVLAFVPEGNRPADTTWNAWLPLLKKSGWTLRSDESGAHTLTRTDSDGERALVVRLGDYNDPKLVLVEPAKKPALTLPPPAAQPEKVSETQSFPYLPAYPGAELTSTHHRDDELTAVLPGTKDMTVLASGSIEKSYQPPPTLSAWELETVTRDALARAGWDVLPPEDPNNLSGVLMAHYAKNGRNIWVEVLRAADDSGSGVRYYVADVGAENWAKDLQEKCRLTLLGVNFDFDKATLRPESTPVLEKAAAALKTAASLKVEVGGHTDNVGDAAYNDKLSGKRAETVRAWLAAHGIAAERLSARGYGSRKPVAENDGDLGRAKNRRVELTCVK